MAKSKAAASKSASVSKPLASKSKAAASKASSVSRAAASKAGSVSKAAAAQSASLSKSKSLSLSKSQSLSASKSKSLSLSLSKSASRVQISLTVPSIKTSTAASAITTTAAFPTGTTLATTATANSTAATSTSTTSAPAMATTPVFMSATGYDYVGCFDTPAAPFTTYSLAAFSIDACASACQRGALSVEGEPISLFGLGTCTTAACEFATQMVCSCYKPATKVATLAARDPLDCGAARDVFSPYAAANKVWQLSADDTGTALRAVRRNESTTVAFPTSTAAALVTYVSPTPSAAGFASLGCKQYYDDNTESVVGPALGASFLVPNGTVQACADLCEDEAAAAGTAPYTLFALGPCEGGVAKCGANPPVNCGCVAPAVAAGSLQAASGSSCKLGPNGVEAKYLESRYVYQWDATSAQAAVEAARSSASAAAATATADGN